MLTMGPMTADVLPMMLTKTATTVESICDRRRGRNNYIVP